MTISPAFQGGSLDEKKMRHKADGMGVFEEGNVECLAVPGTAVWDEIRVVVPMAAICPPYSYLK